MRYPVICHQTLVPVLPDMQNFIISDESNTEQSFLVCKIANQYSKKKPKTRKKNGDHDDDDCYSICHL